MKINPIKLEDFKQAIKTGKHPHIDYVGHRGCWRVMFSNGKDVKGAEGLKRVVTAYPDDPEFFFVMDSEEKGWAELLEECCSEYVKWDELPLDRRLAITKKDPEKFKRIGDFVFIGSMIFHLDNINLVNFLNSERVKVKKLLNQTRSWMYQHIKPMPNKPVHFKGNAFIIDGLDIKIYMNDGEVAHPPIYEEDVPEGFTILAEIEAGDEGLQYPESEAELLALVYAMKNSK